MELGHLRRNLLITQTLARSALEADFLLITGA
jgi:predicted glycosyltransferase